jgi:hypothetical protein
MSCSRLAVVVALGVVCGCSASPGPVSDGPLAGTVSGQTFVGRAAFVEDKFSPDSYFVTVFDVAIQGCQWPTSPDYRVVQVSIPSGDWRPGGVYTIDSAGPVLGNLGGPNGRTSALGRLEVVSPTAASGDLGAVRLRLEAEVGSDHVEGQVSVLDCRNQ